MALPGVGLSCLPWRHLVVACSMLGGLAFAAIGMLMSQPVLKGGPVEIALHGFGALAIVIGAVVWLRSPTPRIGQLLLLLGTFYYLGDLRASSDPTLFAIGFCLAYLWTAMVGHIALALPGGRVTGALAGLLVVACYLGAVGTQVGRYVTEAPQPPWWWNVAPGPNTGWAKASSLVYIGLALAVLLLLAHRWGSATMLRRRQATAMWVAAGVAGVAGIAAATVAAFGAPTEVRVGILLVALTVDLVVIPLVVLARRIHQEMAQGRAAQAMLDLERVEPLAPHPVRLQRALAEAIGDPTLTVTYPATGLPDSPARIHPPPSGRAVTPIRRREALVALVEHDAALMEQHRVVEAALGVAGLAIENAQLHAVQHEQTEELRRSRTRLSTAAYEERHRIQRDLHDGAQQQLYAVLLLLDVARHNLTGATPDAATAADTVGQAHTLLHHAIATLRNLTQGIYPAELVTHGLVAAVAHLTDVSAVPVRVDVAAGRWPRHVELTAYFLVAEALANTYKHAGASRVDLTVRPDGSRLIVEIVDDGRGGAAGRPGSGLSGLYDRVAAAGGRLTVTSFPGRGTRLRAVLPVEELCG
ncbi:sensor histidine kinase [Micromonospora sp. NPDC003197]